jgi:hypothetical protein
MSHMLNLMRVPHEHVRVRTKQDLVHHLRTSPYAIIHIATHGMFRRRRAAADRFCGLWTRRGIMRRGDLQSLEGQLRGRTVVCTACGAAHMAFRKPFVRITGCKHYIAPKRRPTFCNAILFAHVFYHKHLVLKRSVKSAFNEYKRGYKNPHRFVIESASSKSM